MPEEGASPASRAELILMEASGRVARYRFLPFRAMEWGLLGRHWRCLKSLAFLELVSVLPVPHVPLHRKVGLIRWQSLAFRGLASDRIRVLGTLDQSSSHQLLELPCNAYLPSFASGDLPFSLPFTMISKTSESP